MNTRGGEATIDSTQQHAAKQGSWWQLPFFRRCCLLVLAVVVAWGCSVPGQFLWLDETEIVDGGYRIRNRGEVAAVLFSSLDTYQDRLTGGSSSAGGYYRPVYAASISLDWAMWQGRAWCFHLENLLWHTAVCVLLYQLGRVFTGDDDAALIAALLFAVHPQHAQSVAWISGRKDLMCAAFSGAAIVLLVSRAELISASAKKWLLPGAAGFAVLAALSKEGAFLIPVFLIPVLLFLRRRRPADEPAGPGLTTYSVAVLSLSVAAVFCFRTWVVGSAQLDSSWPRATWGSSVSVHAQIWWTLLSRCFLPSPRLSDGWQVPIDPGTAELTAIAGWGFGVALLLVLYTRRNLLFIPLLWFVVWMLPYSGVTPLRHLYADRYLYPASWGLILATVMWLKPLTQHLTRRMRTGVMVTGVTVLAILSARECQNWMSNESLFQRATEQDPHYREGWSALAYSRLKVDDMPMVVEYSARAQQAKPQYHSYWSPVSTHNNHGIALLRLGRPAEARQQFELALQARPGNSLVHYHLGLTSAAMNDLEAAEQHYRRSLEIHSEQHLAAANLGYVCMQLGKLKESEKILADVVRRHPNDTRSRMNLGTVLLLSGSFRQAVGAFRALEEMTPEDPIALAKLAWSLAKSGQTQEARQVLQRAVEIDPRQQTVLHVQNLLNETN